MADLTVQGVGAKVSAPAGAAQGAGQSASKDPIDICKKTKSVPKPITLEETEKAIQREQRALEELQAKATKCSDELKGMDKKLNPTEYKAKQNELRALNNKIKGHKGQKSMLKNYLDKLKSPVDPSKPIPTPTPKPPKVKSGFIKGLKKFGKIGAGLAVIAGLALLLIKSCDGKKDETPVAPVKPTPVKEEEPKQTLQPVKEEETVNSTIAQNRDTIEGIAERYGVPVDKLKELNSDKIRRFRTPSGKMIEGFIVGTEIKLPEKTKKVEGLNDRQGAIKDYNEDIIKNFDKIPKELWNQFTTPEFRKKHHLGEYKVAA